MPALSWEEFARDLRQARHFTEQIYVHSLEGCVWQGFLPRLRSFDWSDVSPPPEAKAAGVIRRLLQALLSSSAHPVRAAAVAATASLLISRASTSDR